MPEAQRAVTVRSGVESMRIGRMYHEPIGHSVVTALRASIIAGRCDRYPGLAKPHPGLSSLGPSGPNPESVNSHWKGTTTGVVTYHSSFLGSAGCVRVFGMRRPGLRGASAPATPDPRFLGVPKHWMMLAVEAGGPYPVRRFVWGRR
jgi:hypothetical protein